ncbi:selenocysteine-specific translation elongation factor [Aliarcobacter butzleri]|uniref:selenocysteine-specific translation elongation factor n=1 Tax=Aliarcobacter butzleri TaxID=28197 RepID=UPI001EDD5788|nr:selenocysteine-specific translation elongation factor [Aliarcobacter butzleri]MCG3697169.1 selenocysteine-specific translation elongation factor [Aliarcobacter butzleri]MCG3700333.1 selenocysteine-specific translation elongation factor [Aliarcobacter butzleri]MDN5082743.1 selenocysteine-specific translation elongation factor [Aliarcobacter butzleri]MDN5084643.1 selenocysteine-specific translation elongation factor [Aliarcobacter butzleri]MDN5090875.1 selenocysteine-specific translation elon
MSNIIIGTAGHIDHGKTALIRALNGFEGDTTNEEKQRGITIDLSFSNLSKGQQNIAFIDVPGHEKLVKNMIAGAFGFDYVMLVVSASEGIKPQTIEHIEIINLLGLKEIIVVITKKDLVTLDELELQKESILEFLKEFDFDVKFISCVSIYDENSIEKLKTQLFSIKNSIKQEENFFRFYIDRIFSPKGFGTVVTGTVLGKKCELDEKVFICQTQKETKIKNIQVHNQNVLEANISNRAALNLQNIDANSLNKGDLITKKGYIRGFDGIDISFKCLKNKKLNHNQTYTLFIGAKKVDVKVLLFDCISSLENGFATLKANEQLFTVFEEKVILRSGNETICGGKVLNPIIDPMRKNQKRNLLEFLEKRDFVNAYKQLLEVHKKGLGIISSTQRFALSHEKAIEFAQNMEDVFVDTKNLIIYSLSTKEDIKKFIKDIYTKNSYALLSNASINLRLKWASQAFIQTALDELENEEFLIKDGLLYKNANIKEDFAKDLENIVLNRVKIEDVTPTAPYNIYDELDLDRKLGDDIFKTLTSKKQLIRLQHNIFIHFESLNKIIKAMREIIKEDGYIEIHNFKQRFDLSRKYLVCYLDYLDNFSDIKKLDTKRVFV